MLYLHNIEQSQFVSNAAFTPAVGDTAHGVT